MDINLTITKKQNEFIKADCDEVLYGGAAGGGKSYGQVADAFLKAMEYGGIKQLLLRSSFPELERSLIMTALEMIPRGLYKYNRTRHRMTFINGSIIEFGYLDSDAHVTNYQSAEYDMIRFDELTHFTEYQYTYMKSRVRGVNGFPKQIKSSTNPGSRGHAWVKARFIDPAPPCRVFSEGGQTRVFIPARVQDNKFLMQADPDYIKRLRSLGENERKALLEGVWDIFEGQYFPEFSRGVHVCAPFPIPPFWKRFRGLDYGLDMTACLWLAVDTSGRVYVYRELCEPDLTLSAAAEKISALTPENERILYTAASPDLWNRRQDTGISGVQIMADAGLCALYKADPRRVAGWRNLREYLKPSKDGARLVIFDTCANLIRSLPSLVHDRLDPEDAADTPHEITHSPEALRYALMTRPAAPKINPLPEGNFTAGELEDIKRESGLLGAVRR